MRTKTAKKKKSKTTTRKQISEKPRIVILDNDETTGSYWLLFTILDMLFDSKHKKLHLQSLIPSLTDLFIKTNTFRPGLVKLIKVLYTLRSNKLLDAVVMYTYQTKLFYLPDNSTVAYFDSNGEQVSAATIIDYCFGYIATGNVQSFCNVIISRDEHREALGLAETDDLGSKSIELVLRKLNIKPTNDLRGLIFIDDCYNNMPQASKYTLGKLTNMYISPYKSPYIVDVKNAIKKLEYIYKSTLHKYVPKNVFLKYINQNYSVCSPKDVSFSYDKIDLTTLANSIKTYYTTGKF